MARETLGRVGWPGAAGYWVLGWLVTSAGLLALAIIVAIVRAQSSPAPPQSMDIIGHIQAFHGGLTFAFSAIVIAVAIVIALPIQATALYLRCNKAGNAIFAAVAGLSFAAAIVSFVVVRAGDPLVLMLDPSPEQLTVGLIGCYLIHVVVLWVARWLAGRARRVKSPSAAF